MKQHRFPGCVNMCSRDDCKTVMNRHKEHMAYYGATDDDIRIVNMKKDPHWDKFAKTNYLLVFQTYLGWKVYMLHTGCFASIPEYETKEEKK